MLKFDFVTTYVISYHYENFLLGIVLLLLYV